MKKLTFLLSAAFLLSSFFSQAATKTWTGATNTNWSVTTNWTGGTPVANDDVVININAAIQVDAAVPTLNSLTVSGSATVSLNANAANRTITLNLAGTSFNVGSGSTLTLNGGTGGGGRTMNIAFGAAANVASIAGIFVVSSVNATCTYTATNSTTTVTGTLRSTGGTITSTAANLNIASGGTYNHARDGGAIPTATWNATSTCLITGVTTTMPTGIGQTFGHFTWNCAGQTGNLYFASNMTIHGNFTITTTNTGSIRLSNTGTGYTIAVTGSFSQAAGTFRLNNNNGACTMTVGGDFTLTGGTCTIVSGAASSSITVSGDVNITTGTLILSEDANIGTLNVAGDFSFTSGTIDASVGTAVPAGAVVFNGTATQTYTSGGTITGDIHITVNNGAFLQMAAEATVVTGDAFILSSGATLGITSANGITTAGTASGNIRSTNRTYDVGAIYVYNGTVAQNTGTGYPTALTGSLTINNAAGVTIVDAARSITTGTLNLTSGTFSTMPVATNRLSMGSTAAINRSGGSMTGALQGAGIYNVNYTLNSKTTGPELSGSGLNNVTVNLTAGQTLTLDQNRAPDGNLTVTAGTFDLSTFTINRSGAGGTLTVSNGATLKIGGTNTFPSNYTTHTLGVSGTVEYSGTAQAVSAESYGNLTFSGSGAKTLTGGSLTTVNGAFTVNSGPQAVIPPTGRLTVVGATSLSGAQCMVIQSDATGTGSFRDNGTITYSSATVDCQRYLSADLWHYICIPFADMNAWTYFNIFMKYYDEPLHHFKYVIAPGADSTLASNGLGYAMFNYADITVDQVRNNLNTGTVNIPVSRSYDNGTSDYDGWNLVGNPYPSAVDLSLLTGSWTNVVASAWFWDPGAGNYTVFPSGAPPYGTHSQYCPPEQGFFVHCNDASATPSTPGSGIVVMNNAARVHNSEAFLKSSADEPSNLLRIHAEGGSNSYYNDISVYFDKSRSGAYEPGFDAERYSGFGYAPQIYTTIPGYELTVNALPDTTAQMSVPMGFTESLAGTYTITASNLESFDLTTGISIQDLKESITQDLRTNPVYTFSHSPANDPNRFLLLFSNLHTGTPVHPGTSDITVYSSNGDIYVGNLSGANTGGTLVVYDMIGKEVFRSALENTAVNKFKTDLPAGYYIARVITPNQTVSRKVFLN